DSVKVGIRFSERWWEGSRVSSPQLGGVSSTDRPTRTVVYPSYGIGGDSATMIVSYTWAQDAFRFGSYVQGKDSPAEQELLNIIFKDLTDMHGIVDKDGNPDYTYLPSLKLDYYAWSWYGNEFSVGAFALFGPSQFNRLYPHVTKPAFGLLHFAGEATSCHHAWIVGALNGAYRSLAEIFIAEGRQDLISRLKTSECFANAGTDEINPLLVEKQVALGQQHRM
ncbi:FAD-linked reductase, partial [Ceratobasidium sp. AG-I]